jgi:uncharacterized protein (TIGR02646 family)
MRPIDNSIVDLPADWQIRADEAAAAVLDSNNKPEAINARSAVWAAVKEGLAALSREKCWYCETKRRRADFAVDHFRPKNAVSRLDCPDHVGYWWLAFRLSNLRYSCTFCNSRRRDLETGLTGGKQDRFPIASDGVRARLPEHELTAENALLLDPTIPADTTLLFFEIDGRVLPSRQQGSIEALRADISISLYHLNHSGLKRARKQLYSRIRQMVEEGDVYFQVGPDDPRVQAARESVVRRIMSIMSPEHEYLAAACGFLNMFVQGEQRGWLEGVIA